MNKVNKLFIFGLLLTMFSCGDFLEEEAWGPTDSNFWQTAQHAEQGINSAYQPLWTEEMYGRAEWFFSTTGDDFQCGRNKASINQWENFNYQTDIGYFNGHWNDAWRVIRRSADVLSNVPNISMDTDLKERILGEAHFLTGFTYFNLMQKYGGMPIYDYENAPDNFYIPRATDEQTWEYIEKHLTKAAEYLKWDDFSGRANKGAALGLLSKVHAYQKDWGNALDIAGQVIGSHEYELYPDFKKLFTPEANHCSEQLFAIQGTEVWSAGPITPIVFLPQNINNGWSYFHPNEDLVNEYESGDPRLDVTVMRENDVVPFLSLDGGQFVYNPTEMKSATGYHFKKFAHIYGQETPPGWESNLNIPVLRYADVLLIKAEAEIHENGVGAGDVYINEVRSRVGLLPVSGAGLDELIHERRCELAGELQRHYDLVRWGLAQQEYADGSADTRGVRNFDPTKHHVFPIPQRAIDASKSTLKQNAPY